MMRLKYKHDNRFEVKVRVAKVHNGVSKQTEIDRKFYDLYIDGKLYAKCIDMMSVNQIIYQKLDGKYGLIKESDYESV